MAPNFWWVNQGKTDEQNRNFLSAPKQHAGERKQPSWAAVKDVQTGDIIFHYKQMAIQGASIATSDPREYFDAEEAEPNKRDKRRVDLNYFEVKSIPIANIKPYLEEMKKTIPRNFPLDKNGNGNFGYLYNFSLPAARRIREIYREIHNEDFPEEIRKHFEPMPDALAVIPVATDDQTIQLLQKKKQIILYGPPGTGKTYDTKRIAVEIMEV